MENENVNELRPETELPEEGSITVKRNKTVDFIAKIICLLLAFFIWYYAAITDTAVYEKEIKSLPVTIENKTDFTAFTGDGATVDVVLSGNRNSINKINASAIKAKVVVGEVLTSGQYTYEIRYEGLPNGVTVKSASISSLQVYVDNKKEEEITLYVEMENLPDNVECEFSAESAVKKITVSGPAVTVNEIKRAVLKLDLSGAPTDKSFSLEGDILLLDENGREIKTGYLELSHTKVSADVTVTVEKEINVSVSFLHGIANTDDYEISVNPVKVTVRGEISKVNSAEIKCVIDEKAVKNGKPDSYNLIIPDGITASNNTVKATVTFDSTVIKEKAFSVAVSGSTQTINVTVRGKASEIDALTASDIAAEIDEGTVNDGVGTVKFTFNNENASSVYEVYQNGMPYIATVNTEA